MPNSRFIQPGANGPSFVSRVLILGYYDGATDGVLQFGDNGPVYRFDWIDEVHNPDGADTRTFVLRPLPDNALDRLAATLADFHEPNWPTWFPMWSFPTKEDQQKIEEKFDAVLAEAGEPEWSITTSDTAHFIHFEACPSFVIAGQDRVVR